MVLSFSSFQLIVLIWIAVAVFIFFLLQRIKAPYGRHASASWGPLVNNRLGWLLMELPAFAVMGYFLIKNIESIPPVVQVMMGLFCLHYFNRTVIFPFRLHTKGKKMPVLIVGSAIFFNLVSTFLQGYYFMHFANYTGSWFTDIRFIGGVALFFTGLFINWKADHILIHLRKPNETHYTIPGGWLFEWVSCPNMMGELIEWGGFALLCWNLPSLAFFIWSSANLVPRAMAHHQWYKNKFPGYPGNRKSIVPFIV